jgi:hypothetical protein
MYMNRRSRMSRRRVLFIAVVISVLVITPALYGQQTVKTEGTNFIARANVGFDLFDLGFAFGVGGGYRFPVGTGTSEVIVDVYWSPPFKETYTSGNWDYEESTELLILSARVDWLFLYKPGMSGFFPVVGAGFFAGALWWEETSTYRFPPYDVIPDDAEYFASGSVFSVGAAYSFKDRFEARFEVPVLVFFGYYTAVAIPFTASFLYKF